jgi:hypothetical protein
VSLEKSDPEILIDLWLTSGCHLSVWKCALQLPEWLDFIHIH